jgi:hypothetical protein
MSAISGVDYTREKLDILLKKLELRMLTKEDAHELIPLLEDEINNARKYGNIEYERVLVGLLNILGMYIENKINLYESSIDILDRLNVIKLSNV